MGTVLVGIAGLLIGAGIAWAIAAYRAKGGSTAAHDGDTGPHAGFASSSVPLLATPGQGPPPEEIARMRRTAPLLAQVEAAPLERVIACGQSATVGALAVELLLLELRGPGGQLLLHWRRLDVDPTRPPRPSDHLGRPRFAHPGQPAVALADDVGTTYEARTGSSSSSLVSGEAHIWFVPAVPAEARVLSVTVERLGGGRWPPPAPEELVFEGPWRFEVPLAAPPV